MATKKTTTKKSAHANHVTYERHMSVAIPKIMRNLTADEIGKVTWSTGKENVKLFHSVLKDAMDTYGDPVYWKNSFYAIFPMDKDGRDATQVVVAAIEWFHGTQAKTTQYGVYSTGYACD